MSTFVNVLYQSHFTVIGGVETFVFELAKLMNKYGRDLTILYGSGHPDQIERIRQYCPIYRIDEVRKPIVCKRAIFNYNVDPIDDIQAEEYIQIDHADFKSKLLQDWGYKPIVTDKITTYYAVSQNNARVFQELTGRKIDVVYNPISLGDEPRVMTLISPQRISPEKGMKRLEKMIQELDKIGVPYVWHIFANGRLSIDSPNIMYHTPDLGVRGWIKQADYMVLLSDTEGFPYTAYESLCLGTPIIITRLGMLDELGADDTNSIVLDFDMSNLNVREIYDRAGTFKFDYKPKPDGWLKIIPDKRKEPWVAPDRVKIRVIKKYTDVVLNRNLDPGFEYYTSGERASIITSNGYAIYV